LVSAKFNDLEHDLFENIEIKNLLNSLDEGAFVIDNEDNLVFYNNNAPLALKTNLEEFLNKNIRLVYYFENLFKEQIIPAHIRDLASGYKISNIYIIDEQSHYFENERIELYNGSGEIKGTLYLVRDITKEIRLEISLSNEIKLDNLSGLYNSKSFHEEIEKEISRSSRYGHEFSILFIDINNFKVFNDTLGHKAGDEIIKFTGESLKNAIRKNVDSAYRYGGDEFTAILPNTPAKRSTIVANRILSNFQNGFKEKLKAIISDEAYDLNFDNFILKGGKSKKIGLSIGIAGYQIGKPVDKLIKEADIAMYKAKKGQDVPICIYDED
jgi:diguanylate cyclase (GGDEF)-like protein